MLAGEVPAAFFPNFSYKFSPTRPVSILKANPGSGNGNLDCN